MLGRSVWRLNGLDNCLYLTTDVELSQLIATVIPVLHLMACVVASLHEEIG